MRLLIADDEPAMLRFLRADLATLADDIVTVDNGTQALDQLRASHFDVFLTDIEMPGIRGDELLLQTVGEFPSTVVISMTGQGRVPAAVSALKTGAFDYIEKPLPDPEVLHRTIKSAGEHAKVLRRNAQLEHLLTQQTSYEGMFGSSKAMREAFTLIDSVAHSDATVLIQGESGTGKELAARALHQRSGRRDRPFIPINCAALSDTLLQSELFGYVKGAFTGADVARAGVFEAANKGTIFLDEIGHVSPAVQVSLLRVLQEREVRRVGSTQPVSVDVRVVAATNADLMTEVQKGGFREDLFYRLNVIGLRLPPLREREGDISILAHQLLVKHAQKLRKELTRFTPTAVRMLTDYAWPGNVRELENVAQRAAIFAHTDPVDVGHLPESVRGKSAPISVPEAGEVLTDTPFAEGKRNAVMGYERRYLSEVLRRAEGNISQAARISGLDRSNLRRLLREHGLEAKEVTTQRP